MGLAPLAEPGELLLQGRPLPLRGAAGARLQPLDGAVQRRRRVRMAGDRSVAQHGLRAGGGHHHVGGLPRLGIDHRVAQVPVGAVHRAVADLVVGDPGAQRAVPVDQPRAAEHQAVAEQRQEGVAHGARADRVHGEPLALPVARAAHGALLLDDALLVAVLPTPRCAAPARRVRCRGGSCPPAPAGAARSPLGGDAGVVGAGHPQRVVALHPVPADQQVLHHVVHGVPHVQGAGDVGQRQSSPRSAARGRRGRHRTRARPSSARWPPARPARVRSGPAAPRRLAAVVDRWSGPCRCWIVAGGGLIRNYERDRSSSITATRLGSRSPHSRR